MSVGPVRSAQPVVAPSKPKEVQKQEALEPADKVTISSEAAKLAARDVDHDGDSQ